MDIDLGRVFVPALLAVGGLCFAWALILTLCGRGYVAFTLDPYLLPHEDHSEGEAEIRREMRRRNGQHTALTTSLGGLLLVAVGVVLLLL